MRNPDCLESHASIGIRQEGYERLLLDLVAPSVRAAAKTALFELDSLAGESLAVLHDRIWLQVGRALVGAGYGGLWRELYQLSDYGRFDEYEPGDEDRFLALEDVDVPAPPPGFSLPPPSPHVAEAGRGMMGT